MLIKCPYCNLEFAAEPWIIGPCPKCTNRYDWDEYNNDIWPLWESKDFYQTWYGPQLRPQHCPPEYVVVYNYDKFLRYINKELRSLRETKSKLPKILRLTRPLSETPRYDVLLKVANQLNNGYQVYKRLSSKKNNEV